MPRCIEVIDDVRSHIFLPTWNPDTLPEGVSLESSLAAADGVVVVDKAQGVDATNADAGIGALLVDAGQVGSAL